MGRGRGMEGKSGSGAIGRGWEGNQEREESEGE